MLEFFHVLFRVVSGSPPRAPNLLGIIATCLFELRCSTAVAAEKLPMQEEERLLRFCSSFVAKDEQTLQSLMVDCSAKPTCAATPSKQLYNGAQSHCMPLKTELFAKKRLKLRLLLAAPCFARSWSMRTWANPQCLRSIT
eukprot:5894964-Amphidinium_carterae.1